MRSENKFEAASSDEEKRFISASETKEKDLIRAVQADAVRNYIALTCDDTTAWVSKMIDYRLDESDIDKHDGTRIIRAALGANKPNIIRFLLEKGAKDDYIYIIRRPRSAAECEMEAFFIEKTFASLVAAGLGEQFESDFGRFLYKGLYDARILVLIMRFVQRDVCNSKRKG